MHNPILTAFGQTDILGNYDRSLHRIVVLSLGKIVGEVLPEQCGEHETAYAYEYRGVTRGRDGVTPIGATFDPVGMKRRITSVMFNGDALAFEAAQLRLAKRDA